MKKNITVIAEAGVNHNGKLSLAKKMIKLASKAGADFVKFQIYKTDNLIVPKAPKAKYQLLNMKSKSGESQYQMLKEYELGYKEHLELIKSCKKNKIKYLGSIFDVESLNFLLKHSKYIKIPSGEITNLNLLKKIKGDGLKVILSTGLSNFTEVKKAVNLLLKNKIKKANLTILHCNSEYPSTRLEDLNLNVIKKFKKKFKANVGYSDHTNTDISAITCVALGGTVIEKHFTLNQKLKGPDHSSSLNPLQLKNYIQKIRHANISLGNGIKKITKSEKKNLNYIRKSIYAKKDIKKNERFSEENIICKRPIVKGVKSEDFYKILHKKSKFNIKKNYPIKL